MGYAHKYSPPKFSNSLIFSGELPHISVRSSKCSFTALPELLLFNLLMVLLKSCLKFRIFSFTWSYPILICARSSSLCFLKAMPLNSDLVLCSLRYFKRSSIRSADHLQFFSFFLNLFEVFVSDGEAFLFDPLAP